MDPLANMIVALKNAGDAGKEVAHVQYSKVKEAILAVLEKEGYIKSFAKKSLKGKPVLEITLMVENRVPKIKGVQRISKTSKRVYKKAGELKPVKNGYGILVMSTPSGVMTGKDARKAKLGGEVLFSMW